MLIRKILYFQSSRPGSTINYNYDYDVLVEMYSAIESINPIRAKRLHNMDNDKYKFFNHWLQPNSDSIYNNDNIEVDEFTLVLSGEKSIIDFAVKGFEKKGYIVLNGNAFNLLKIENDRHTNLNNITLYKTQTPIVTSVKDERDRVYYLSIHEERFFNVLGKNLLGKYKKYYNKEYTGELFFDIENTLFIKKRTIGIKNNYVIGYNNFNIFIQADKDMQKIAYYLGLGQNNSIGMGHISYITSWGC